MYSGELHVAFLLKYNRGLRGQGQRATDLDTEAILSALPDWVGVEERVIDKLSFQAIIARCTKLQWRTVFLLMIKELPVLTDEEYGSLVCFAQRYVLYGGFSGVMGNAKFYARRVKDTVGYYQRRMEETSAQRSSAGKNGGRPRKKQKQEKEKTGASQLWRPEDWHQQRHIIDGLQ